MALPTLLIRAAAGIRHVQAGRTATAGVVLGVRAVLSRLASACKDGFCLLSQE